MAAEKKKSKKKKLKALKPEPFLKKTRTEVLELFTKMVHHAYQMNFRLDESDNPVAWYGDKPVKPAHDKKLDMEEFLIEARNAFGRNLN